MARDWEKARMQLVMQRQNVIEELAKGFVAGESERQLDLLLKLQSAIDVLDTADEDEEIEDEDDEE